MERFEMFHSVSSEWPRSSESSHQVALSTAEVLVWGYGDNAISQAQQRLFEAMDDRDLEAATIWKRVLSLLAKREI